MSCVTIPANSSTPPYPAAQLQTEHRRTSLASAARFSSHCSFLFLFLLQWETEVRSSADCLRPALPHPRGCSARPSSPPTHRTDSGTAAGGIVCNTVPCCPRLKEGQTEGLWELHCSIPAAGRQRAVRTFDPGHPMISSLSTISRAIETRDARNACGAAQPGHYHQYRAVTGMGSLDS